MQNDLIICSDRLIEYEDPFLSIDFELVLDDDNNII